MDGRRSAADRYRPLRPDVGSLGATAARSERPAYAARRSGRVGSGRRLRFHAFSSPSAKLPVRSFVTVSGSCSLPLLKRPIWSFPGTSSRRPMPSLKRPWRILPGFSGSCSMPSLNRPTCALGTSVSRSRRSARPRCRSTRAPSVVCPLTRTSLSSRPLGATAYMEPRAIGLTVHRLVTSSGADSHPGTNSSDPRSA